MRGPQGTPWVGGYRAPRRGHEIAVIGRPVAAAFGVRHIERDAIAGDHLRRMPARTTEWRAGARGRELAGRTGACRRNSTP